MREQQLPESHRTEPINQFIKRNKPARPQFMRDMRVVVLILLAAGTTAAPSIDCTTAFRDEDQAVAAYVVRSRFICVTAILNIQKSNTIRTAV
jgi:hypothetical protein